MRRILLFWTILLLSATGSTAVARPHTITGSGKIHIDTYRVKPYEGLHVSRGIEATLVEGTPGELHIEADEEIFPYLSIYVEDGTLYLGIDNEISTVRNCKIAISVPCPERPTSLTATSGAEIRCQTILKTPKLNIQASSAAELEVAAECDGCLLTASSGAEIKANIAAQRCAIDASSGAEIGIMGTCVECRIEVSSGSSCKGRNFITSKADINASSAASAHITCRNLLRAEASSAGKIVYWGDCKSTHIEKSSAGSITNRK